MTRRALAVVGGGIGGLTLAAALDPRQFDVTVYEAQPERAGAGAALGLWPAARTALESIGARLPRAEAAAGTSGSLRDMTGAPLVTARGVPVQLVGRPDLLDCVSAVVPGSVRRRQELVTDATALDAYLVVGADGVRSIVRGHVWSPAAERVATDYVVLRALTPGLPDGSIAGEYWGAGTLFGIIPVGLDATYWFSAHRSTAGPEPLDPAAVIAEAIWAFAGAAPAVRDILAAAGPDTVATRLWIAPPMPRYAHGRYVVIGDAAHAMTPNLGRGACEAIVDAVTLARTLNRGGDLRLWQARRLPVTQAARTASSALMRVALTESWEGSRNRMLRTIGRLGARG